MLEICTSIRTPHLGGDAGIKSIGIRDSGKLVPVNFRLKYTGTRDRDTELGFMAA